MPLTCSNCGKELPDNAKFCGDCGTSVPEENKPNYCANCIAELPEGVKFCLQCGKPAMIASNTIYPFPERDEAIKDELNATSPRIVKYETTKTIDDIEDFEQNRGTIAARARKWAEYDTSRLERMHWFQELLIQRIVSGGIVFDFTMETINFSTNKPNHHRAIFYKEFINYYLFKLRQQELVTWEDPPQPTPLFIDYLKKVAGWSDEDIAEYKIKLPYLDEIEGWAAKDDELFPPPVQLREEVAGAILNFMSDEGVLVVYTDCSQAGKRVEIEIAEREISSAYGYDRRKAEVLERSKSGTPVCGAIFNRIPFVTNEYRYKEKVLKQIEVTVKFSYSETQKLEEKVTVFKGKVAELDWQAETKPKTPAPPARSTTGVSNTATLQGATITLKSVEHNANECVYYVEVEDPGHLDGVLPAEIYSPLGEGESGLASAGGYAIAGTDVRPSYAPMPPAPQKSKGTRLYVRNVKRR